MPLNQKKSDSLYQDYLDYQSNASEPPLDEMPYSMDSNPQSERGEIPLQEDFEEELPEQRLHYSAKIDYFLNNSIVVTAVLLILVLVIAFLI
ncbi:hypothetical protein CYJ57_05120 [Falseniella ignava]|uniref:Uncharacterized protein n=1 Tax=Falseniella ignava TaxID=137730 RepID=A0A2I1JYY4_9LACT|nr:hypothetical protein [Falseniella ignava]PKY88601.1 hypothetical protein CYJ57_05120 [Falseniella ignava]